MPYGITQCYLPPDRGEIPVVTPAEAGTRFSLGRHFISVCNQPPRSTQPSTLRGTVKWVPAKGRWCSAAGE